MKRKIILLLSAIVFCVTATSQQYQKHEFSVGLMAGAMSLNYDLSEGKSTNKLGAGVGFGYTYFFKKSIGLATGVEFAFYNTEIELNSFSDNHAAFDLDLHKDFEFQYTLSNYKEKQNAFYLNVPIMLHYQFTDGDKMKFYGAGGFKLGLPVSGKYKSSEGAKLSTQGYYPHNGATIDDIYFRGFGDFNTRSYNSEIKYKMLFSLAVEVGSKWTLPKDMALYTGLYMDYGLNDISEGSKNDLSLVQYNQINPEDHIFNGVATSSSVGSLSSSEALVKKINATSYGLKVRLAFGK